MEQQHLTARIESGLRLWREPVESRVRAARLLLTRDGSPSIDGIDATIRAFGVAIVLLLSAFGYGRPGDSGFLNVADPLFVAAGLVLYNLLVITVLGVPWKHTPGFFLFLLDWIVASTAILLTGGALSPFNVLYYALIIGAALRVGLSRSLLLVSCCCIIYVTLSLVHPDPEPSVRLPLLVAQITPLAMVMFMSVGMKRALEVEARKVQIEEQDAASLRLLNNLTQTVLSVSPDLEHVLRSMASATREAVSADRGMAVLLQPADSSSEAVPAFPNEENLLIIADADPNPDVLAPGEANALASALATRKPVRLHGKPPGTGGEGDAPRAQIIVCVPFELNERVIGALFVRRQADRPFTNAEVSLLTAIGQQMAVAVRLARLYDLEREKALRSAERERLERDLLSTVSHELRTPLTSIKTCIGALSESGREDSVRTPLETRMLNNIGRSTERLINLVNELLDVSRLHAGRVTLNLQELNLGETVLDTAAQVRPLLDARNQLLEVDLPLRGSARWNKLTTLADRRRIEQVLLNLLSNANKYGPTGSKIVVGATPRDGEVKVFVRDEGPGIARFEQRLVFDKFYQGSTALEDGGKPDSTGLGLSIARSIVELHGGRIGIASKAGSGSTFYFTLPIEDGAAEAPTQLSGDLVGSEL